MECDGRTAYFTLPGTGNAGVCGNALSSGGDTGARFGPGPVPLKAGPPHPCGLSPRAGGERPGRYGLPH